MRTLLALLVSLLFVSCSALRTECCSDLGQEDDDDLYIQNGRVYRTQRPQTQTYYRKQYNYSTGFWDWYSYTNSYMYAYPYPHQVVVVKPIVVEPTKSYTPGKRPDRSEFRSTPAPTQSNTRRGRN